MQTGTHITIRSFTVRLRSAAHRPAAPKLGPAAPGACSRIVARRAGTILAALAFGVVPAMGLYTPMASASNTGGSHYWSAASTGGVEPGTAPPRSDASRKRAHKRAGPPVITSLALDASALFDEGRPLRLRYRLKGRARSLRVRVIVRTADGRYVRTVELGRQPTGRLRRHDLTREQLGVATTGTYKLRLSAIDRRGRGAVRAARVPVWLKFTYADHRFPLAGAFDWGGDGSRFGAGRPGHTHQGQDLAAAEGVPVVAPYGGTIAWINYQAQGAGWYVVLDAADGRDYVFMHLQAGSIEVRQGDRVPTGRLLGRVGTSGVSSGPHLHFEVWVDGPWQFGGKPVNPLPLLKSWYQTAPGGATASSTATGTPRMARSASAPLDADDTP